MEDTDQFRLAKAFLSQLRKPALQSVASCTRPPPLNPVEQPPLPPDCLVQFFIFALLDQVC